MTKIDMHENFKKLPAMCAARLPGTEEPILIKRGEMGYWKAPRLDVDGYNLRKGVNKYQVEAMLVGSMFGWSVPGANPDVYEAEALAKVVIA